MLVVCMCSSLLLANQNQAILEGKAECVMEVNSRRVLYEWNADTRLPMASTTKIVTAMTVFSLCEDLKEEVSIPAIAIGVEGSSAYLKEGERYTIEELLYGLMLRSGNDCATALAIHSAGSLAAFATKMNETAQKSGALHSNFENPHGLPADGHYTTASDLTAITCFAMQNSAFKQIVSTKYYEPRHWKNKNKMLINYKGAIGVKTGYTKEAGRCLVTAAEREGMMLVCTVLNCPTMYERTSQLLDDAFSAYQMVQLMDKGEKFLVGDRYGVVRESFSYPLLQGEEEAVEYDISPSENCFNHEIIGHLKITVAKRLLFLTNLYKL